MTRSRRTDRPEHVFAWFGDGLESISRLRLNGGVVGRLAAIGVVALLVVLGLFVAGAHWSVSSIHVLAAIAAVLLIVGSMLFGILWYATRQPETALMEGAEILVHKRLQIATKSGVVIEEPPIPTFDPTMPLIEPSDLTALPDALAPKPELPGDRPHG